MEKFLEFNGKAVSFLNVDGQWWIALKPICDVLNVNYDRAYRNVKADEILGQLCAEQHMVAADGRLRKMVSLPEKFIYGWLFSLRSESEGLLEYKKECYELLFEYFHGTLTQRTSLLKTKTQAEIELERLEADLKEHPIFKRIQELKTTTKQVKKNLWNLDQEYVNSQMPLWETEN